MTITEKGTSQPQTFSFKWKIERFFDDCEKVGDSYTSQAFLIQYAAKDTKWSLRVFPKGEAERENDKDFVALYLFFEGDGDPEITVSYKMSIMSAQLRVSKLIEAKTFNASGYWGLPKFMKQSVIKNVENGALINDTLTILCEITFCSATQDVTEKFKDYDDILNKIGKGFEDYEKLLENNCFTDVTFNIHNKKMYLHKAILMCRNSVFKAMFEHEMKEKNESSVDITDVDYEIMKELIRFIYSGKVKNIKNIAKDLLIAADKYDVTELKALCEKTICHDLTVDNTIECLKLTEMYESIHLKTLTINFVVEHYEKVVVKTEFEELPSKIMCEIIRAVAQKNKAI